MADTPLAFSSNERTFGGLPTQLLKNRFFEENATQVKGAAMLARPGTDELTDYGAGPIRANYSLPGLFDGALFTVSGDTLYRRDADGTETQINGLVFGSGSVSMTGVAGAGYERLFIADGSLLQFYDGGTKADGTLSGSTQVSEGDTVRIGNVWYEWTATVEDGGGTAGDPWRVLIGADLEGSMDNLYAAITATGTRGVTYSNNLGGQNTEVVADAPTTDTGGTTSLRVEARTDLDAGNDIETTVTSTNTVPAVSWGSATLTGGGVHGLSGVEVPDGRPPISVATLKSYILVAIGSSDRFYWIKPGEVTINALDFATAESQPDDTIAVVAVGDTAWFVGEGSTEVWYTTGNTGSPFAPVSGRVYGRGAIEGTVVNIRNTVYLVGPDYVVYGIAGSPQRVSNHGVEQTIREALGS